MRSDRSVDDIMRDCFPRRELAPAARSVAGALLDGRSALLVTPDALQRELAWQVAAAAGRLPVLIVAGSGHGLEHRAERLADELDLVARPLDARLTDHTVEALTEQLAGGKWDAALVSGRGLSDPRLMRAARALKARLLVIEEAHRLSVHSPCYDLAWLHAAQIAREAETVLALSDVTGAAARAEVVEHIAPGDCHVDVTGLDRPGLRIEALNVPTPPQKDAHLLGLFLDPPERAVIYANEPFEAERIAALIYEERGLDALDITNLDAGEFAGALRRFCEGGLRVLVTGGALQPAYGWPTIPLAASVSFPDSLETLHRQLHVAAGDGARGVLIYESGEEEPERLRQAARTAALDAGQLLALHAAAVSGERLSDFELTRRTGLQPREINLGIDALIHAGSVRPLARGDDWIRGEPHEPLTSTILERWGRHATEIRDVCLQRAERVPEFALSRRCRRKALGEALEYSLAEAECRCDRCNTQTPVRISGRIPGGYPLRTRDFRGWALALYQRPAEDIPTEGPGRLVHRLKYVGEEGCGRRLAWLMHKRVRESRTYRDCDVVVAVPPCHGGREHAPADLLAREIGRLSDLPVAEALASAREREPQKDLHSLEEKKRNIAGAFRVTSAELVADSTVLLVDDIYDSGASMQEAGRVLMLAGAKDVRMLAAVRTADGWRRST